VAARARHHGATDESDLNTECDSELQELASKADQEGEYEQRMAFLRETDGTVAVRLSADEPVTSSAMAVDVEEPPQQQSVMHDEPMQPQQILERAPSLLDTMAIDASHQAEVSLLSHDEDLSNLEPLEDDEHDNEFDIVEESFDMQPQELVDEAVDPAPVTPSRVSIGSSSFDLLHLPITQQHSIDGSEHHDDDPLAEFATDIATIRTTSCDLLEPASPMAPAKTLVLRPTTSSAEDEMRSASSASSSALSVDNLQTHDAQPQPPQSMRLMRVSEWLIQHRKQHTAQTLKHPHAVEQIRNSPKLAQSHPPPTPALVPLSQAIKSQRKETEPRSQSSVLRASSSGALTSSKPARSNSATATTSTPARSTSSAATAPTSTAMTPVVPSSSSGSRTTATPSSVTKASSQSTTTRSRKPSISRATLLAIARRETKGSTAPSATSTTTTTASSTATTKPVSSVAAVPATPPAPTIAAPSVARTTSAGATTATSTTTTAPSTSIRTTRSATAKAAIDSAADGARPGRVTGSKRKLPNFDAAHEKLFATMSPITDSAKAKRPKFDERPQQPVVPANLFRPNNANVSSPAKRVNALSSVAIEAETAARLASPSTPVRPIAAVKHQEAAASPGSPLQRSTTGIR